MIRNDGEYREAVARMKEEQKRFELYTKELVKEGLKPDEIERVTDPMRSFHLQLSEEVESYERLKRGEVQELNNLRGLGHLLISIRIASKLTQRQLADKLGVHETQVSRDERNEYFGITLERAAKILDAMGVRINIKVDLPSEEAALA